MKVKTFAICRKKMLQTRIVCCLPLAALLVHILLQQRPPQGFICSTATFQKKILKCINFISTLLRTSLANPQESNKSCWLAVASTSSQHLRQLPSILGKPFAKIYQYRNNILFSLPTQTVSRMSGMSQPIPAHFVLTKSRQSLEWK